MQPIFALVDCNNFYVSCERLFRPDLRSTPVVVLSNNDGCVISRSEEAKQLGIKMGVPFFEVQSFEKTHGLVAFSANFSLYGEISRRVMEKLKTMVPRFEIASIDEAFIDLQGINIPLALYGLAIKHRIYQDVGIPVCVGIAPTKTLAKLANYAAKKYKGTKGVVDLTSQIRQKKLMAITPVNEVWGVGRALSKQLTFMQIHTALDLAKLSPLEIKKRFSVVLERTNRELNGQSVLMLEDVFAIKKQIMYSRSFGVKICEYQQLKEAIVFFIIRAAEKLREQGSLMKKLILFTQTSRHINQYTYQNTLTAKLPTFTNDTRLLIKQGILLLEQLWKPNIQYHKAGVILSDFCQRERAQLDLWCSQSYPIEKSNKLMSLIDHINKQGEVEVFFAAQGMCNPWQMRQKYLSPKFLSKWEDVIKVR